MLSCIIPSYKDPLLLNTIKDVIEHSVGDIEIIPVIDGYECQIDFGFDKRIRPVYLKENKGMRNAINVGVGIAEGKYLMRSDEHCSFGSEFDRIILSNIEDNWIVSPIRYSLDVDKWEREGEPVIYEKLIIGKSSPNYGWKFSAFPWRDRDEQRKGYDVDENMAMQGSCWFMSRKHWDKVIKKLDNAYGVLYQDTTEMIMKTWQSGGKLMINKNTWYAHKNRRFKRSHHYSASKASKDFQYALSIWKGYYNKEIKPKWNVRNADNAVGATL